MADQPRGATEVIWRPVADLVPNARNARKHSNDQLDKIEKSIVAFGFNNPVLTKGDGIVAGHGRVLVAERLGMETVPTIDLAHLSDIEARAYLIADNRTAELAEWDDEVLADEFHALADDGFDVSLTGFDQDEVAETSAGSGTASEDEVAEVAEDAVATSRTGDVWSCGTHRVICGDATNEADVATVLDGAKADFVFTSPPYNVGIKYSAADDELGAVEYRELVEGVLTQCHEALADGRMIAWNVGVSPKSRPHVHGRWLEEVGFRMYRHIVWKKTGAQIPLWQHSTKKPIARNYYPNYNHEIIYIMSKGDVVKGEPTEMPAELSMDVWDISQFSAGGNNHPAAFPVKLVRLAMLAMSGPGEVIYEPFLGSGTTMIAAEETGRVCRGVDIDPIYVDVAVERWQKFTGQEAIHAETGQTFAEVKAERAKPVE